MTTVTPDEDQAAGDDVAAAGPSAPTASWAHRFGFDRFSALYLLIAFFLFVNALTLDAKKAQ